MSPKTVYSEEDIPRVLGAPMRRGVYSAEHGEQQPWK